MITFFSILFALLGINVLLVVFSLKGTSKNRKKPLQKIPRGAVPKLYPEHYSEADYKKAV
jgi:hypothetical protein